MEDMSSLRSKRNRIEFYAYLGMPDREIASLLGLSLKTIQTTLRKPVLNHRTIFFVGYMDTSTEIINKITNTVQDKEHG